MLNKGNTPTITAAVTTLDLTGGETVTDIGFGGGLGLDLLLDAVGDRGLVHGVEPSTDMLARARKSHPDEVTSGRLRLHEATMATLPFDGGHLDGWISLNTIYFMSDLDQAFRELARVLGPAGRGVLGVADPEWLATQPVAKHGFTVRPIDDVVTALTAAGLDVETRTVTASVETGGGAPYNLLLCRPATSDEHPSGS